MPAFDSAVPLGPLTTLLLVMAAKHYLIDFVAQTEWMARGKERVTGWQAPLVVHAGSHALATLGIALVFKPALWWIALVDFVVHGLIDRGKAVASHRTRFAMTDPRFWWLMGFDQFLHQVTNVALAVLLVLG
ncbi:DUF3307 domain-containing protein [Methylobacterium sp. WL12]|uniref:DUF3307 domain-containing protein n=1 Tax=Methylobacterium sp. WL12 TaxID=2603890 RepID=UPI0011CA4051|nr:DUF3307 domain-containing protein [Methylobacterium sp. WL12]TXM72433.1 DUF3307 domain-containing protein [Methylobacterium sp. WL12]